MPIIYDEKGAIKRPGLKIEFDQTMIMHYAQCALSVKYFAEHFFYIQNPITGKQLIQLRDYQIRIIEAFQNNRLNILLSGRQQGKTTCSAIYLLWCACFKKDKTIAILANKADTAKGILEDIKLAYEFLPSYLKPGVFEYNKFNITFENGCKIFAKATSVDALRGESVSELFLDEFSHVPPNISDAFWTANYPTISTGGSCIIVSTPNGTANLFYKIWKDAIDKRNTFIPTKVDWWEVPGRDEKWKDEQIRNIGLVKFNQEFACRFEGSTVTLIDAQYITEHVRWSEPKTRPDDFTKVWESPQPNHKYLISIDTGGGVGSDFSVMNVFDITFYPKEPMKQVSIWKRNDIAPPGFSEILFESLKYWNNAYVIGETNGLGSEVLNRLAVDYEYEEIYYDYDDGKFGIFADKKSKPKACVLFKDELENGRMILQDTDTIDELSYFEEAEPGIYRAKVGRNFHDDCVITCVWAAHFIKSRFFEDARDDWMKKSPKTYTFFNKKIKKDKESSSIDEPNDLEENQYNPEIDEYDQAAEEAYRAFLEADEEENGDNWLDRDINGRG